MITLRPYQADMVGRLREALKTSSRVLGVAPCGAGKTVMFSYIASRARERGRRIGIFAHRSELIDQISRTLRDFCVPHGIISAGATIDRRHSVFVISAQTYARRGLQVPAFDLGVIDEAHHCTSGSTWNKCMERSPEARWIGVTATPERLDGRGLAETFDTMIEGPSMAQLIGLGALSRYRLFTPSTVDMGAVHTLGGDYQRDEAAAAVDRPAITGDAVKHYIRHLNGAPAVAFCASVAHAQHVADSFRAQGFSAASIDGKMDRHERRRIVSDFSAGRLSVLTSAELINEGFDVPGIHGAILLRPTKSLAVYIQQVGRAVRLCAGKGRAIILDHVGNCDRHGLPDDDREWSLNGRSKQKDKAPPETSRECPKCHARVPVRLMTCPEHGCGYKFEFKPRIVDQVDGDLIEVDLDQARAAAAAKKPKSPQMKAQASARSRDALEDLFIRQSRDKCAAAGITFTNEHRERAIRRAGHVLEARNAKRA